MNLNTPQDFYKFYLVDHYKHKVSYLNYLLKLPEPIETFAIYNNHTTFKLSDFHKSIQIELRQTYFHAIETIFELILALQPDENGLPQDKKVFDLMTNSGLGTIGFIDKILKDQTKLSSLLNRTVMLNNHSYTFIRHLFYCGLINKSEEIEKEIVSSLLVIQKGLETLANDFGNRHEYNSYKHSLRVLPIANTLNLLNASTMESIFEFDLRTSVTFAAKKNSEDKTTFVTKILDSERDSQMIMFCSNLLSNIIRIRLLCFKLTDQEQPVLMFDSEAFDSARAHNLDIAEMSITFEKKLK